MSRVILLSFTACVLGALACSDRHLSSPRTVDQSSARDLAMERSLGVTLTGTETAVGGTGRFAGAAGSATITGMSFLFGPRAGTGSYELDGTLVFDPV